MGTRSLVTVISNHKYKVAQYCQWDGNFTGVGLDICRQIKKMDIKVLKSKVNHCKFIETASHKEFITRVNKDPNWTNNYPQLSRSAGAKVLSYIYDGSNGMLLTDNSEFVNDHISCEYSYKLDLDKEVLECYHGGFKAGRRPDIKITFREIKKMTTDMLERLLEENKDG